MKRINNAGTYGLLVNGTIIRMMAAGSSAPALACPSPADTAALHFSSSAGPADLCLAVAVVIYSIVALLAPLIAPPCASAQADAAAAAVHPHQNLDYAPDECAKTRHVILLGLNAWEADMCVRMLVSLALGSVIGWTLHRLDRPAGIRTMASISHGACAFTIGGMFCEASGPQSWDSARVAAAIPAGVGFLGGAAIWKASTGPKVHGLPTAASVWVAASVGIMAGGAIYVPAIFVTVAAAICIQIAPDADPKEEAPEPAFFGCGVLVRRTSTRTFLEV